MVPPGTGPRGAAEHAYYITCVDVVKDEETGEVVELRCTYDPETRGRVDARRAQGAGDAALGLGGPRPRRRGAPVRPSLHQA